MIISCCWYDICEFLLLILELFPPWGGWLQVYQSFKENMMRLAEIVLLTRVPWDLFWVVTVYSWILYLHMHVDKWQFCLLGCFRYDVTINDVFSQMILSYFWKTRDVVFSRFQETGTQRENLTGEQIRVSRTNDSTSWDCSDFCLDARIKREWTTLYLP